jgi:Undecaprenyl-phosphate galactose phosphotransferase WbaP
LSAARIVPFPSFAPTACPPIDNPHRPALCAFLLLATDVATFWIVFFTFLGGHALVKHHGAPWVHSLPLLELLLVLYGICGLYPGISVGAVEEVKRISMACGGAFLFVSLAIAFDGEKFMLGVWLFLACFVTAIISAIARSTMRQFLCRFSWWGYPVALVGGGDAAVLTLRRLKREPRIGLRPVAVVSDQIDARRLEGVTVCRMEHLHSVKECGVRHAIIVAPELTEAEFEEALDRSGDRFPHVIIIPDSNLIWKTGAYTRDVVGVLGLQVGNNLAHPVSRAAKRMIDLSLCLLFSPVLLVLMAAIAVLVALESGFPILYSQKRLGRMGREFHIWKFRTMVHNASQTLERTLASDPELRAEWLANHKLRRDPRITKIGRILRRTSLDELPQIWNVLRGEMSLVGPRPIVGAEIARYKEAYSRYIKTTPGVTGLWQVSGRSRTTYAERVAFDSFYVRNWSVWLDIYLLARTVSVIFTGDGAY